MKRGMAGKTSRRKGGRGYSILTFGREVREWKSK